MVLYEALGGGLAGVQTQKKKTTTTYQLIPQQHRNSHLPNRRHINARLLLDRWPIEIPLTREIDTHGPIPNQLGRDLELLPRHPANHHIAQRQAILQLPPDLLMHSMVRTLQPRAAREQLHVRDIDAIHRRAVVGEQRGEGAPDDLGAVDYRDCAAVQAVAVGEDVVVDA